jgi:transposase
VTDQHQLRIVGGIDTHKDVHVAAALSTSGQLLATAEFPATQVGYQQLAGWLGEHGRLVVVGIEGCGSYGTGITRYLRLIGVEVVEVTRPGRQLRRRRGKSDAIDAEAAARAALAGCGLSVPKSGDGPVEAMRALRLARRSAIKARDQATNQLHALVVTAPEPIRAALAGLAISALVDALLEGHPLLDAAQPGYTSAMTSLARRWLDLDRETRRLASELAELVKASAPPGLLDQRGVGPDVAASLMIAAGDNPDRLRSEASFAALCGASPLDASSGRQQRHRLNRGGNRDANMALWRIVFVRLRWDPSTRDYLERRTTEGKTRPEIIRCLKRYVARDIYRILTATTP